VGWARVSLQPGESREVVITTEARLLARYDTAKQAWRIPAGTFDVYAADAPGRAPRMLRARLAGRSIAP
jgi:hypothetical protein